MPKVIIILQRPKRYGHYYRLSATDAILESHLDVSWDQFLGPLLGWVLLDTNAKARMCSDTFERPRSPDTELGKLRQSQECNQQYCIPNNLVTVVANWPSPH